MQEIWKQNKMPLRKRDILRDYCLTAAELETQFGRFKSTGTFSFSTIQGIMGDQFSKGLLWRLKDTAHHLFGTEGSSTTVAALDWSIGFLFHECVIILESSYQLQKYYPAAETLVSRAQASQRSAPETFEPVRRFIFEQVLETEGILTKMVERVSTLLRTINLLFCHYLNGERENCHLARFIYEREDILRSVFKELYPELIHQVYGNCPELVPLGAARSFFESGHVPRAERAARKAQEICPDCRDAHVLLKKIEESEAFGAALRQI